MAPSVSPKKSWEGFAGSVITCVAGGSLAVVLLLDGPWWGGALLGAATAVAATVGDLAESTVKRDLGIKDMSTILPGHGGVMDRLDSLVLVAPVGLGPARCRRPAHLSRPARLARGRRRVASAATLEAP